MTRFRAIFFWGCLVFLGYAGIVAIGASAIASNAKSSYKTTNYNRRFQVVGYFVGSGSLKSVDDIAYNYLTVINYSFALPAKGGSGNILPINFPQTLQLLVREAHAHDVKVLVSIGGFNIGDGPGIDTRFEVLAGKPKSRELFARSAMQMVRKFGLDGIDIDWEFPDPVEPSASNFVSLMKILSDSLHKSGKTLTAAVESHHRPYAYGIESESFKYIDWLNIMAYDNESIGSHRPHLITPHSPYWLDEVSFDYWINTRGLPRGKAVMGVPFYGVGTIKGITFQGVGTRIKQYSYRSLLAKGAGPYSDVYDSIYYNGIITMKRKVRLAMERGGGIMIWEISEDTTGQNSLLKAIHEAISVSLRKSLVL